MERKDEDVKVKVSKSQKELWLSFVEKVKDSKMKADKFQSLSHLVRFCVQGYIEGNLIKKETSSQNGAKKESEIEGRTFVLTEVKGEIKEMKKLMIAQNEQLHIVSTHVMNGQRKFPSDSIQSMEKNDIESEIINLLEINPLNSEQLAKAFKLPEHRILRFLNPMLKNHILGFNDKMEYVFVNSEAQLKELKFNEVE